MSSVGAMRLLSCRFASEIVTPSGVPRRSVTQCLFVPGRPRSVGFGPVARPPFFAATDAESMAARDQSSSPARCRRSSRIRCNSSHTPAFCQSRRRRQHVIPEQPKTSRGSISQGMPERSTNTIPRSASRSEHRGRPPFGFGGSSGNSGATAAHISSLNNSRMPSKRRTTGEGSVRRSYEGVLGLVVLDSPGGSLQAGLSIGAQIYDLGFDTIVGPGRECYSACALIWISGIQRNLSAASIIGVHAAYIIDDAGQPWTSGSANASLGAFLNEIGIPEPAIRYITEAGANDVLSITPEIARRLGIDVWEHRDDRIITPFEEPTAYAFARQAAELIGMSQECAFLFSLNGTTLEEMGRQRLSEGHDKFGGELYGDLVPLASNLVKTGREQQGFRAWCLRTEARLRYEELPTGIDSPSFDCMRAGTPDEHTICTFPDLWALDRTLANPLRPLSGGGKPRDLCHYS